MVGPNRGKCKSKGAGDRAVAPWICWWDNRKLKSVERILWLSYRGGWGLRVKGAHELANGTNIASFCNLRHPFLLLAQSGNLLPFWPASCCCCSKGQFGLHRPPGMVLAAEPLHPCFGIFAGGFVFEEAYLRNNLFRVCRLCCNLGLNMVVSGCLLGKEIWLPRHVKQCRGYCPMFGKGLWRGCDFC